MAKRDQRDSSSSLRKRDSEMRDAPTSSSDEIVLTPTRQFWRRLFRASPASSSSSSSSRRFKRKNRQNRDKDDENSHSSSSSSSQSGSDSSEPSRKPNREQRLAKYLSIDTTSPCRPISLIANDGDLTFHRTSSDTRDDNNDDDDYDEESSTDCRDDVRLLHGPVIFQSHLLHTPKALRETIEAEDRVALLSEHDDLLENRRGSYNVDCVEPQTINEPAALQRLSLLTLKQQLATQEEKFHSPANYCLPQKQNIESVSESDQNKPQQPVVPLQIEFPSGETTKGVNPITASPQKSSAKQSKPKIQSTSKNSTTATDCEVESPSSALNPLGEETPAFSEIIQDRTQRHKAFYLLRLRNSQKKNNANTRPSVHGDLWTVTELPSEDESSRFSQVSESLVSRLRISRSGSGDRSGAFSAGSKNKHVIMEDQVALISAN